MSADCVLLPLRTPRILMIVSTIKVMAARSASGIDTPLNSIVYRANVTATAAIPPLWMTSSSAQP